MDPVDNLLLCSWGDIKTAKTTLALTFPTPIFHQDFDFSFRRAIPRIEQNNPNIKVVIIPANVVATVPLIESADIVSKQYQMPVKLSRGNVKGSLGLWENEVIPDFIAAVMSPKIKTIVVDTGTLFRKLNTDAQLERAQISAQRNGRTRESLSQIEYGIPNTEMRGLISAVRTYGKNLCITHHIGGIYQDVLKPNGSESVRIGDTWDGFNQLGAYVDVIVRTTIDKTTTPGISVPMAHIETCGYTLEAEGMALPYPSFESLLGLINGLRNGHST